MIADGDWSIYSASDPRWRMTGHMTSDALSAREILLQKVKDYEKTLGRRPDDLQISFMKD